MNRGEVLKGVGVSAIITVVLEALFYYIGNGFGWFTAGCTESPGIACPSAWAGFAGYFPYTLPIIFFLTLAVYFLIKTLKR